MARWSIARGAALAALLCAAAARADEPEKTGRFLINLRVGPSVVLTNGNPAGDLGLDLGYAVTPDLRGYLLLLPQAELTAGASLLVLPLGFQYDFRIPNTALYLYPRVALGYAAIVSSDMPTIHVGWFEPAFGLKYVLRGRWNFGFDPISFPVLFTFSRTTGEYRAHIYFGVNL
jgi:hypothetical protein